MMRSHLIIIACMSLVGWQSTTNAEAETLSPLSQAEIEAARQRMLEAISKANASGAISLRTETAKVATDASSPPEQDKASDRTATYAVARSCPKKEMYRAGGAQDDAADIREIDTLRKIITSPDASGKADASRALAWKYLHLGFYAEARAIAAAHALESDELALLMALADLGLGNSFAASTALAQFKNCDDAFDALQFAASIEAGEAVSPARLKAISAGELSRIAPALAATAAEILALFAFDHGEEEIALGYFAIALAARGEETSPALAVLGKLLGDTIAIPDTDVQQVARLAQSQDPMRHRAVAAITRDIDAPSQPYDGFIEDLAALEPGLDDTAAIKGARLLVSADRFDDALRLLVKSARTHEGSIASISEAQNMIQSALVGETNTLRLLAVDAYLANIDLLAAPELTAAVSQHLAGWDAYDLLERTIDATPGLAPRETKQLRNMIAAGRIAAAASFNSTENVAPTVEIHDTLGRFSTALTQQEDLHWLDALEFHRGVAEEIASMDERLSDE